MSRHFRRCSVSTSLVRVDVVDVADTFSRQHHELLPEINILGKHQSSF